MKEQPFIALVSGAASGIGAECVKQYLAMGVHVYGIDKDEDKLLTLKHQLKGSTGAFTPVVCDLVNEQPSSLGELGIAFEADAKVALVNNIGGSDMTTNQFLAHDWSDFISSYEFNVKPAFTLSKLMIPVMKSANWGRIVMISSVAARKPLPAVGAQYCAAKSALLGLTRKLADEFSEYGILTNTVCPGVIATDRILAGWDKKSPQQVQVDLQKFPCKRLGTPQDVAQMVCFLGSDQNNYMSGSISDVNGGLYMS
ncbi:SDR family NAD(P)-dependent oxidoreductase [Pseudoalteromonas tunicata]|uniref:3-ketoacyl-(Acyl-carrier-protein) reductase n=1 Tax=Pseudoalteromonas tunicata D2 TaxID=87626 RepID=A4C855_9GAMM|nr:SDR family NAD(P)-dependent oxidoreductase [Pseudoalteromonas tunicata]ATC93275.1 hypothetical protein PTUN_a0490 [Pseudoalteromonas tunicata]AXT32331.1 SDR family oxidoreductase [Pseudoalteromonas tunicata]EAR28770.1 3-ketoacyl-(acyl-carrier-protein) reductase [Pseudoalteromonas tunicata D2]